MKVYLYPFFRGEDKGDGGVRRVVEAQVKYLPQFGIELVSDPREADVIACHIMAPSSLISKFPDKPIISHCHGLYWSEYEWEEWSYKANADVMELIRIADTVTAPSEWVSQAIRRNTLRNVETIFHGIDCEEWTPGNHEGYVLWNKTRIDPVCDPGPMNEVAELIPSIPFISTVGKESKNVHITGRLSYEEGKSYVRNASIYLATARETFGIGTLEALACEVPVVAFDWGGQSEFLTHKKDAWLARPGDIDGLAEGIEWAIANRKEAGRAARETAKQFTWDRASEQYAQLYRSAFDSYSARFHAPKVSVIVTAYKLEDYLDACLESVSKQTFRDWECIVVDDASPDQCGEIAEQWSKRDRRFRVLHNSENQYLAGARNVGVRASKGRYILPLDADDRLTENAIEILSGALDSDRSIHISYGNVLFIEPSGEEWHSGWPIEYNFDWHVSMARNLLPYSSMFRKEVWEQTCGYRTRLRTGEDADFWIRAASYGFQPKMVTTQDTLIYNNRDGSMSRVEEKISWEDWFPWIKQRELTPAGAVTEKQIPVPSYDPPVIEIVIPCGPGHEQYVMTAIDSVDAQTFRNFSCTIINDTGKSFDFLLPSWAKVLETDHVGPAKARNIAIKNSKSPLYICLDADDYLQPSALQVMFNEWMRTGDIIYSDFYDNKGDGNLRVYECPNYDANILVEHGCIHPITSLVPKKYWEQVGGYDEETTAWEDWIFELACAEKGICSTRVPFPLFTYRKYTGIRREENYKEKEGKSKEEIISRFGIYFEGAKLMACGSCGQNKRGTVQQSAPLSALRAQNQSRSPDGATKMFNPAGGAAGVPYKASSGRTYRFTGNRPQYVLNVDTDYFLQRGFVIVHEGSVSPAISVADRAKPEEKEPVSAGKAKR